MRMASPNTLPMSSLLSSYCALKEERALVIMRGGQLLQCMLPEELHAFALGMESTGGAVCSLCTAPQDLGHNSGNVFSSHLERPSFLVNTDNSYNVSSKKNQERKMRACNKNLQQVLATYSPGVGSGPGTHLIHKHGASAVFGGRGLWQQLLSLAVAGKSAGYGCSSSATLAKTSTSS